MTQNIEAEEAVIGSVLINPSLYKPVSDILSESDFQIHRLQWIWHTFGVLVEAGMNIDNVTVADELERSGKLQEAGGPAYLTKLVARVDNSSNAETHAANVLDYSAKRQLIDTFGKGAYWSNNGRRAADIQADMIQGIASIRVPNARADKHTQTLAEAVLDAHGITSKAAEGLSSAVPTGFFDLDHMLDGGLYAPDFVLLAGRPGQGKTALVVNVADAAARKQKRVCVFTLEMANTQIAMRLISTYSGVPFGSQRRGLLKEDDWPRYFKAVEELSEYPVVLNDLPAITTRDMKRVLRKVGDVDLVVVDYLQLAGPDGNYKSREQEVSSVSRGLKSLAKEFNVPVLAAAQLSRAMEQRSDKRPTLSDLRESGALEQDADIVIFIHKPDEEKPYDTELLVAKQRNGATGKVHLLYKPEETRFVSQAYRDLNEPQWRNEPLPVRKDLE